MIRRLPCVAVQVHVDSALLTEGELELSSGALVFEQLRLQGCLA